MERRKICRYFERGSCKKQNCPFVHLSNAKKPCKFYTQTGFCRKGVSCNYYHPTKQQQKKQKHFKQYKKVQQVKPKEQYSSESQNQKLEEETHYEQKKYLVKEQNIEQRQGQIQIIQQDQTKNQYTLEAAQKSSKIDFLLGMGQQSDQDEQQQQMRKTQENQDFSQAQSQKFNLQFFKIYPKKFPDYSKTAQFKQRLAKTQQKYFKEVPFLKLMNNLTDPHQKQYYQIIRKFQDSFQLIQQTNPREYIIKLRPMLYEKQMNLHFQMIQETLDLKINQIQYPQVKAKFQILNESIPEQYKQKFISILEKYHSKKSLFQTLKYLLNHFQKIYEQSKFKLENQYFKQIQFTQKLKQQKQRSLNAVQTKQNKNQIKKKTTSKLKQKGQFRDYIQIPYGKDQKYEYQNLNYEITIDYLHMQNCAYLVVQKMLIFVQCQCSKVMMYLLTASERKQLRIGARIKCKKCLDIIRIQWQRQLVQPKHTLIAKMGIMNGKLLDIGGTGFKFGCNCDIQILKEKLYLPGEKIQINCHSCFVHMYILFNGLKFFNPFVKEFQIQNDKELPLKGACKHYKLSFRWIRYGCCGRVFSCDECHALGSIRPHDKVNGITMICGYCASEQLMSDNCSKCLKQLIKGIDKGGHWEGGLGCRDQTLLSRKDNKKYAGMTKNKQK